MLSRVHLLLCSAPPPDRPEHLGRLGGREAECGDGPRKGIETPSRGTRRDLDRDGSVPIRRGEVSNHPPRSRSAPEGPVARVRSLSSPAHDSGPRPLHAVPRDRGRHIRPNTRRSRQGAAGTLAAADRRTAALPSHPRRRGSHHLRRFRSCLSADRRLTPGRIAEVFAEAGVKKMFTRALDARWGVPEAMAKRLDGSDLAPDLARIGDLETIAPFVSRLAEECRTRGIDFRNAFEFRMADSNHGFGSPAKRLGNR